jgi:hypothetical protein
MDGGHATFCLLLRGTAVKLCVFAVNSCVCVRVYVCICFTFQDLHFVKKM